MNSFRLPEQRTIDLSGKTGLVTGSGRGVGEAINWVLAECGARVIGVGTTIETDDFSLETKIEAQDGTFRGRFDR
ncbi:hypothetical protein [Ruegeria profundi]|uniref:Short-chain dehydrogenase n=1 Tax=Ruegeria profundi TaxID=1685378 RepID=A0A0X3TN35_9RHOB|nr:hypothetical protein [Ruegeria profundi]KUJ77185.1 hypothetical protein AVO44_18440 [Ruegeria profundi]